MVDVYLAQRVVTQAHAITHDADWRDMASVYALIERRMNTYAARLTAMGHFDTQVNNNGFAGWDDNGYSAGVSYVIDWLNDIGTPSTEAVIGIISTFLERRNAGTITMFRHDDTRVDVDPSYDDLDQMYYALSGEMQSLFNSYAQEYCARYL